MYETLSAIERSVLYLAQQQEYPDETIHVLYHLAKIAPRPYLCVLSPRMGTEASAICLGNEGAGGKVMCVLMEGDDSSELPEYDENTELFHFHGFMETITSPSGKTIRSEEIKTQINVPIGLMFFGVDEQKSVTEIYDNLREDIRFFSDDVWRENGIMCGYGYNTIPGVMEALQDSYAIPPMQLRGDLWMTTRKI